MAEVDTIDIPDVTPVTRTVATMSKLIKTTGVPTDARSTATDVTSVTWMQVIKQVSFSIQAAATSLATLVASLASLGPAVMTSSQSVTIATDDARIGPVTETAPASDTASSGLNGRLQRIAQNLTAKTTAGDVAAAATDSGNPVKVGAKAVNAEPTALTNAQRANLITDLVGKLIVLPYANPENFVSGAITTAMTGTTTTSLVAAPAAGLRNYITQITVSNSHATVGTDVIIQDGSGGTTLYTIPAAAVYGGAVITLPTPLRQPTTATAIFCANVTTGASTKVSASGYKGV